MTEVNLPVLIQQMLQPGFYPHEVTEPIQLIQTHISYVLLTGDYAYKLKKAVNFGFLDFSTLEKRKHFCQEELRLNQRGAAELYLEVLPVTMVDEQHHLAGTGKAVEYALKMRQFPQELLFSTLFEQGKLNETHLEDLGKVVAQYHAKSATDDYIRSFGEVPQVRAAIDENYQQTEKYIGGPQTPKQFQETKKYTDNFFVERPELFTRRVENNYIRECHGDLHLRNIALWNDQITLFDCIEFNEPFRFVDVMYDVAFTVMDLEARHSPNLANAFLNTYVEQTGDWEGLQVLPLYLSRQAYVRAKVTSFLLDDPSIPETVKEEAAKTAAQYYTQAWEYTKPKAGKLILMSGVSGSGKSTTAKYLARELQAIQIRSDAVRKHLGGISLGERGGDDLYTPEMTQKTYARLLNLGIILAQQGFNVILDAKYDKQHLRQDAIAQAEKHQLPLQIIYCTAPLEVVQERLANRTGDIADATVDLLTSQLQQAEAFTAAEKPYVQIWDTTQPPQTQLK
ncbi:MULTISPECIES: AAA family ATPase [Cyanophyceae]|uniref:bifunctional aminoglycoside phosphotransferase/ATP-binding protein n=1 Tax=Cyanophyceae TaxID=3028117 RepID=UPI00232DA365|nr:MULTISPECIES: AAA family ATPase [Cyanophyceae]MDB9357574.1 AAA family ATPase [Nodularia spumigena CS-587/03]MDB9317272.1 AAA family ATPase [Nodularia spumigena CS-590/01A]MDB9322509.1 AAA family ATPase [Nodularia spumigena CS-591/07A]MDB9326360.1 AAA family ATPase [Nodularia spumigena CS-590/02]MDB9332230.1 AAA family ATPase [Nodularia spumigena CS-591/04]